MLKHCGFSGKDLIGTIIYYRITYQPQHIIDLIKAKKEDPFDFEGIMHPVMKIDIYPDLQRELNKISGGTKQ